MKEDADLASQHCTTKHYRTDLTDLCESCGLRQIITEGVKNQIILQAKQQKDILTASQFEAYCEKQIDNAQQKMMEMNLAVQRGRNKQLYSRTFIVNFPGVTLIHIWNKERIKALNGLINVDISPSPTHGRHIGEKKHTPPVLSKFEELFYNQNDIESCVDALRQIEPAVINDAQSWIGPLGSKSILVAWIERLEYCNKIRRVSARRDLVPLLNNYFRNLDLGSDARIFGQQTKIYYQYKVEFAALILP